MKFYVFKTCLYFIFNIKLCWQRRFLPFNFSLFCSIVYRGTERTFFKVWWYCGSHGYEGSNNTAFKVWNLIFYFLKNYHVRYYIKLAREAQNRTKEMIRTSIEIFYLRKDRCSTSWPKYSLLMCTLLYNIMLCLSSG